MRPPGFVKHVPFSGRVVVMVVPQHLPVQRGVRAQLLNPWPKLRRKRDVPHSATWLGALAKNRWSNPIFGACLEMWGGQELNLGRGKCRDGARGMEKRRAEVAREGWGPWSVLLLRM